MTNRTQRALMGGMSGLLQHFLTMLFQLIMVPFIINQAGQEALGGYAIIQQIVGYGVLLDFGFSVAMGRYLAQAHDPALKSDRFSELLTVGRNVLLITNSIVSILILVIASNINLFIADSPTIYPDVKFSLYLIAAWTSVRAPLSIYSSALTSTQNLTKLNMIGLLANIIRLVLAFGLVHFEFGLIGLVSANIISELFSGFCQLIIFNKSYERYKIKIEVGNTALAKEMIRFGLGYWGVNLSGVLLLGSDNLIVGALYGAAVGSTFYTTKMLGSMLVTIITKIIENSYPGINQIIGSGDFSAIREIYLRILRYVLLLAIPAAIGVALFLESLVTLWAGEKQFAGRFMTNSLALFVFIQIISYLNSLLVLALGRLTHWASLSMLCGVLGVAGAYYLGKIYGVEWVLLSMAISLIPVLVFLSIKITKCLSIGFLDYINLCKKVFYSCIGLIIFFVIHDILNFSISLYSTIGSIIFFFFIWIFSCWSLGLTEAERLAVKLWVTLYLNKNRV